jgi:hypothetical protein
MVPLDALPHLYRETLRPTSVADAIDCSILHKARRVSMEPESPTARVLPFKRHNVEDKENGQNDVPSIAYGVKPFTPNTKTRVPFGGISNVQNPPLSQRQGNPEKEIIIAPPPTLAKEHVSESYQDKPASECLRKTLDFSPSEDNSKTTLAKASAILAAEVQAQVMKASAVQETKTAVHDMRKVPIMSQDLAAKLARRRVRFSPTFRLMACILLCIS